MVLIILLQSCAKQQHLEPSNSSNQIVLVQRGIQHDSVFELHNQFVLWFAENYSDSSFYYLSDINDYMEFVSRKDVEFSHASYDFIDYIIYSDTMFFAEPYYIVGQGFTKVNGT